MAQVAPTTARETSDHWTERSGRFNAAASHIRHGDAWRDMFRAALGEAPLEIADLGTGTGACALTLAEIGHRVTAVDGSEGMLSIARAGAEERGLPVNFVHATMDDAALPSEAFDVVTLRNVIWTLEVPEAAIRLAARLLRPRGTLLVSDGLWRTQKEEPDAPEFYARLPFRNGLTEADARALLLAGGFTNLRSWGEAIPFNPYETMGEPDFFILTAEKPVSR